VERDQRQLEPVADKQQPHAYGQQRRKRQRGRQRCDAHVDIGQIRGACCAVDERHAVQEEAAGKGAEQEVLQRGFARPRIAPRRADQDVQRQREDFQAQEDGDEVAGLRHDDHAGGRQQQQRDIGAGPPREVRCALQRQQQRQARGHEDRGGGEQPQLIG